MEGSDMNVSDKMDMVSTDMGMKSTDMGIMSTDMGMMSTDMGMMSTDMGMMSTDTDMGVGMSGHQHGAHYRGMDGPGDESGKFILAVQILLPNVHRLKVANLPRNHRS